MTIHSGHPFVPGPEDREPARRFRGRLASPVTIVTAGDETRRLGLTVSSLIVIEGDPALIKPVIGPNSDLWDGVVDTGRFVVHICREGDKAISEVFAGLRPSPGGPFAAFRTEQSDWGPVLVDLPDRAYCTTRQREEIGYSGLVTGSIDRVEVSDMTNPLSYFRGRYRSLG